MLNLTPAQAALLQRGLDRLITNPGQVLESDFRRVVWVLAQMAAREAAESNDLAAMQAASDLAQAAAPPPEMITLAEASRLYNIPSVTLRYHAARGDFAAEKRGKVWHADHHDLVQFLEERSKDEPDPD